MQPSLIATLSKSFQYHDDAFNNGVTATNMADYVYQVTHFLSLSSSYPSSKSNLPCPLYSNSRRYLQLLLHDQCNTGFTRRSIRFLPLYEFPQIGRQTSPVVGHGHEVGKRKSEARPVFQRSSSETVPRDAPIHPQVQRGRII